MKLTIELVPSTCWYTNVRSQVTRSEWDIIRRKSYQLANNKCEICNDTGKNQGFKHDLECHEIWEYDDKVHIQKLIGFISLCPFCHKVKHPGLAQIKNETDIVENQLMKVNKIDYKTTIDLINQAFSIYKERSQYKWILDITYIQVFLNNN